MLLTYFGEDSMHRCGNCDYCRQLNKLDLNEVEIDHIRTSISAILQKGPVEINTLVAATGFTSKEKVLEAISWLVDQGVLGYDASGCLELKERS